MRKNEVCPYVLRHQSWLLKNVLNNYFKAAELHSEICGEYFHNHFISYDRLKQLSDLLFRAKEDLHLIYKRIQDPQKREFEKAAKCLPKETEQRFINNIGLMYHKVMVARELQYMLEYYEADQDVNNQKLKNSLKEYLEKVQNLFETGSKLLAEFITLFKDDVLISAFLYENMKTVRSSPLTQITEQIDWYRDEDNYFKIAEYYFQSGWYKRAKSLVDELLSINPKHEKAVGLLAALNSLRAEES